MTNTLHLYLSVLSRGKSLFFSITPCELNIFVLQQQQNLGQRFGTSKMHLSHQRLWLPSVLRRWFVIVDSMLIVTPIVGFCNCSMFCCVLLHAHSSFAVILMGKRELVDLLCSSSWCLVIVVWLFLTMLWVCLQFVIVVFPDHNNLPFLFVFRSC